MKLRQSPRLKEFPYTGPFAYHLTFVTRGRLPLLATGSTVRLCLEALETACQRHHFRPIAYCVMPDHVHLLLWGQEGSPLRDFARHFKQLSGYRFKCEHGASLWQISYYDHVVRRDEDIAQIAAYIWDNPVRAGMVGSRLDYAFSGPRELMEQA